MLADPRTGRQHVLARWRRYNREFEQYRRDARFAHIEFVVLRSHAEIDRWLAKVAAHVTVVVLVGTLVTPLSRMFIGRMVQVGPNFYNNVLPPIGLGLLAMTATVPLNWSATP